MNINDLRFDTNLNKANSDFNALLSLINKCKEEHLWEGSANLNNVESEIKELLVSIKEWEKKARKLSSKQVA